MGDVGINGALGVTGATAAASPAFYETDVWIATVAILGFIVLILTVINGLFQLRRNLNKSKPDIPVQSYSENSDVVEKSEG